MHTLFSTEGLRSDVAFQRWRETLTEQVMPAEHARLGDGKFNALVEMTEIGGVPILRASNSPASGQTTAQHTRRQDRDSLAIMMKIAGQSIVTQEGREAVHGTGGIMVMDSRPTAITSMTDTQTLYIDVPRARLERVLGSARGYTALAAGADQGTVALAATFFNELLRVHSLLTPGGAARMMDVGLDLVIASIAERLARDVPTPLHGTVVVQRAKAYVEANHGDPALDPPLLSAAVGVSLRRLQELFHERGHHISDWIWLRRLQCAAQRLADPGLLHLSIGAIAYGCGFVNQAHFSRRFKSWRGLSPSDHRQMSLQAVLRA